MNPRKPVPAVSPIDALGILGVIPVVVIDDVAHAAPLTEALIDGGLYGAEITLRTPAALPALAVMAGYDGFLVGAGTLLEPEQVAQVADVGAHFAVSPGHLNEHFAAAAVVTQGRYRAPETPGASTEIRPEALAEFSYPSGPAWQTDP